MDFPGEAGFSWWDCRITAVTTTTTRHHQNVSRVEVYAALWAIPGVFRDRNWFRTPEEHTNPVVPKIGIDRNPQKNQLEIPKFRKKILEMKNFCRENRLFKQKNVSSKRDSASILRIFFSKNFKKFPNFFFPKKILKIFKNYVENFEIFFEIFSFFCTASCWICSCRGFAGPAPRAHSSIERTHQSSLLSGITPGWCRYHLTKSLVDIFR